MDSQKRGKSTAETWQSQQMPAEDLTQIPGQLQFDEEGYPLTQEQLVLDILVDMGYNRM